MSKPRLRNPYTGERQSAVELDAFTADPTSLIDQGWFREVGYFHGDLHKMAERLGFNKTEGEALILMLEGAGDKQIANELGLKGDRAKKIFINITSKIIRLRLDPAFDDLRRNLLGGDYRRAFRDGNINFEANKEPAPAPRKRKPTSSRHPRTGATRS